MKKNVMALAVMGALAVPGVALAQVTLSGGFRMGIMTQTISNPATSFAGAAPAAGTLGVATASRAGLNTSETRVVDNVTQIIFQAREDLGGGLSAFGRFEWRPTLDAAGNSSGSTTNGTSCASNWVGVQSATMGMLRVGCVNTYAGAGGTGGAYTPDYALAFSSNAGIMQTGFVLQNIGVPGTTSMNAYTQYTFFGAGRQGNSVTWNSPSWNGFGIDLVWSSSNLAADSDLQGAFRKGSAYIIAPKYTSGPFSAQYLYFNNKNDNSPRDWINHKIWATYNFSNGISLTGAWNSVRLTAASAIAAVPAAVGTAPQAAIAAGDKISDANKWMVSAKYVTGPYTFSADYAKSLNDKVIGSGTGGQMWTVGGGYDFSKRTQLAMSYSRITNDSRAAFGPLDTTMFSLGGNNDLAQAGETHTFYGVNVTHRF